MVDKASLAEAVKIVTNGVRVHGFQGRSPHLSRTLDNGSLQTVYVRRQIAGVTGRRPAFAIELNYIPGLLLEIWEAHEYWAFGQRLLGGYGIGFSSDVRPSWETNWWTPNTDEEARDLSRIALERFAEEGIHWFDSWRDPVKKLKHLSNEKSPLDTMTSQAVAALLVDFTPVQREQFADLRARVVEGLRHVIETADCVPRYEYVQQDISVAQLFLARLD